MVDGLHGEAGEHALWRVARELKHEVARAHLQLPREVAPPVPGPQHPVKHVRIWSAFVRLINVYLFNTSQQKQFTFTSSTYNFIQWNKNLKHHQYSDYFSIDDIICLSPQRILTASGVAGLPIAHVQWHVAMATECARASVTIQPNPEKA